MAGDVGGGGVVTQTLERKLGRTETNWVAAVESGTGTTVASILFTRRVPVEEVEEAVADLVRVHPRLGSVIVLEGNEYVFRTSKEVRVSVISEVDVTRFEDADEEGTLPWVLVTEEELNTPFGSMDEFDPGLSVFVPKLYMLPDDSQSILVLRLHAAAADMASTATIVKHIVSSMLHHRRRSSGDGGIINPGERAEAVLLPSVEDAIPPGQAKKPFWAHGVDVIGYGLVSRRHAILPFDDSAASNRASKLLRAALTVDATNLLLKECESRGISIHGAINAAALKAVAAYKRVGAKGEHYGTTVLLQCRNRLQPPLPDSTIGFYHAALMRTMHTSEPEPFWDLATRCSQDVDGAIQNCKHFTDMGDLNALMVQAMRFPNLTPSGSLRTSVLSTMYEPVVEDLGLEDAAAEAVGVKDYLSCSSTHGVGPCLALFPFMRQSALQFVFIYSSPLYPKSLMQKLVDSIVFYLSGD